MTESRFKACKGISALFGGNKVKKGNAKQFPLAKEREGVSSRNWKRNSNLCSWRSILKAFEAITSHSSWNSIIIQLLSPHPHLVFNRLLSNKENKSVRDPPNPKNKSLKGASFFSLKTEFWLIQERDDLSRYRPAGHRWAPPSNALSYLSPQNQLAQSQSFMSPLM